MGPLHCGLDVSTGNSTLNQATLICGINNCVLNLTNFQLATAYSLSEDVL